MKKYIIQFKSIGDNWQDLYKVEDLKTARKYDKKFKMKGYKTRIIKMY